MSSSIRCETQSRPPPACSFWRRRRSAPPPAGRRGRVERPCGGGGAGVFGAAAAPRRRWRVAGAPWAGAAGGWGGRFFRRRRTAPLLAGCWGPRFGPLGGVGRAFLAPPPHRGAASGRGAPWAGPAWGWGGRFYRRRRTAPLPAGCWGPRLGPLRGDGAADFGAPAAPRRRWSLAGLPSGGAAGGCGGRVFRRRRTAPPLAGCWGCLESCYETGLLRGTYVS